MVARPPTERLTPWLKPVGESSTRWPGPPIGVVLRHVRDLTLRLLRRDFGEEGHLGHGHEREAQQLKEEPDDEGRQLPSGAPWREEGGAHHGGLTHICG